MNQNHRQSLIGPSETSDSEILKLLEKYAEVTGKNKKKSLLVPLLSSDANKRTQSVLYPLVEFPKGMMSAGGAANELELLRSKTGANVYQE